MADILLLDAMGVLYEAGDDVAELLVPFVGRQGRSDLSAAAIRWIDHWFISGDLGLRKPSAEIYRLASDRLGVRPQEAVFVDDRPRNLDAARSASARSCSIYAALRRNIPIAGSGGWKN